MYSLSGVPTTREDQLNAELGAAFRQMHSINVAIVTEKSRGNVAGVAALLPLYKMWLEKYKTISIQLGQVEFTSFDRFVLSTGNYIEQGVAALPGAIGAVPGAILKGLAPFLLLGGAAYLAVTGKLGKIFR